MTIEFWPRSLLKPRARPKEGSRQPRSRRPKLPITAGKAQQLLSTAIICGDHELASWIDHAVKTEGVTAKPNPRDLDSLKQRLDAVMVPLLS
jgi:hypothetical protein